MRNDRQRKKEGKLDEETLKLTLKAVETNPEFYTVRSFPALLHLCLERSSCLPCCLLSSFHCLPCSAHTSKPSMHRYTHARTYSLTDTLSSLSVCLSGAGMEPPANDPQAAHRQRRFHQHSDRRQHSIRVRTHPAICANAPGARARAAGALLLLCIRFAFASHTILTPLLPLPGGSHRKEPQDLLPLGRARSSTPRVMRGADV